MIRESIPIIYLQGISNYVCIISCISMIHCSGDMHRRNAQCHTYRQLRTPPPGPRSSRSTHPGNCQPHFCPPPGFSHRGSIPHRPRHHMPPLPPPPPPPPQQSPVHYRPAYQPYCPSQEGAYCPGVEDLEDDYTIPSPPCRYHSMMPSPCWAPPNYATWGQPFFGMEPGRAVAPTSVFGTLKV